jgi:hypothetical protein
VTSLVSKVLVPNVVKFAATGDNTISQCKSNRTPSKELNYCGILFFNNYFILFLFASRPEVIN